MVSLFKVFDPLEQFDIVMLYLVPVSCDKLAFLAILSNLSLMIFLVIFLVVENFMELNFFADSKSNKKQVIFIMLFDFVSNIMKDNLAVKRYPFILLFFSTFLIILISNLLGMIPYSITTTSHFIITLYFSLAFFVGTNIIGIVYHKEKFFGLFLPSGVPTLGVPFIILIEYISYFSRIFSLAIRLFANMMSGHILLKILTGFALSIGTATIMTKYAFVVVFPVAIIVCVIFLECAIAFLQAYVFIVLLSIYLNDVINMH